MAPIEQDPGYDGSADEVGRARDALFGAQWRGYVARALSDSAGGAGGGGFRVEPERLAEAIKRLDAELLRLDRLSFDALATRFDPPAFDEVSLNMARNGSIMSRRLAEYLAAWTSQVTATRDALEQELAAYEATDRANAGRRA